MNQHGELRDDLKLPEESEEDNDLSQRIRDGVENGRDVFVTVLGAMNIEKIIEVQEKTA